MSDIDIDLEDEIETPEVTNAELQRLFPNMAGFAVARAALDAHNAYVDAHAATFPEVQSVREKSWRENFTNASTFDTTSPLYSTLDCIARTSEDPAEVATVLAFGEHLVKCAKENLHGLYLRTKSVRPVSTDAVTPEVLASLLSAAETNVSVLLSLTTNGMASEESIWKILPSTQRKRRGATSDSDTYPVYAPPRIRKDSVKLFRENSSTLQLEESTNNGETFIALEGQVGAAVKKHLGMTMAEVRDAFFDGEYTRESLQSAFTHNGRTFRFAERTD